VVYGVMAAEFFTPGFCQIASNAGAEFIIFDMEHGGVGIDMLKAQIAFARGAGVAPVVRVPGVAYHLVAPVLDAGAVGIMAPMVETRDQAENLAKWCRYRPEGLRGLGFGVAHDDYRGGDVVELMQEENERMLVIGLVETAKGISNADEILSVAGIDVRWLGHYDLTNTLGITAQFDRPEFNDAVEKLFSACERHRKAAGFLAASVAQARKWRAKGVRCICYGTDIGVFQSAPSEALQTLKADVKKAGLGCSVATGVVTISRAGNSDRWKDLALIKAERPGRTAFGASEP
jgi:2-keto-3-deoxy-L-rhamnonate aldolase RhmA